MSDFQILAGCIALLCPLATSSPELAAQGVEEDAPVQARVETERAVISNGHLRIQVSLEGQRARTALIENLRAGGKLPIKGEDFAIEFTNGRVVRSSELRLVVARHESAGASGKRLVLELTGEDLRVRMLTELQAGEWWATRRLEVRGAGGRLSRVSLARWRSKGAAGPAGAGKAVSTLGFPSGCGQAVYAEDLFFGLAHPGAENFAAAGTISCSIPAYGELSTEEPARLPPLVIGAGDAGDAWRAFIGYIDATRPVKARMVFLVNDWYWKDKSKPIAAVKALARVKKESGVPIMSFTLDDGWDFDWDEETKIWGRLNRRRFPGGWEALVAAGRPAGMSISLWFGPIGGYSYRPKRIEFARRIGFEIQGDKLCLAGRRYREHVIESFSRWAELGMDYIKVDGFWPNCQDEGHGHAVGPAGAIDQMDRLADVFAAWRRSRPNLVIAYTSGSSPSPFWLQHADFVWRGGRDDSHAGAGEPFDRHNTYLDAVLQAHRGTDMPVSAFVTFDIVQHRVASDRDELIERGCWWLAARGSLHHDWYIQASDLTLPRWKMLARASRWAKSHEQLFRWSRMVGGDPGRGELYGFSAFEGGRGTLALRNPAAEARVLETSLAELLELPDAARSRSYRLRGVYGETRSLEGTLAATAPLRIELPSLAIAVAEVDSAPARNPASSE